jgi:hypothetical protein
MGIFKDIWNTLFGKPKKQEKFERDGSISEREMKVVHKKNEVKAESTLTCVEKQTELPNHQVCNDAKKTTNVYSDDLSMLKPKKRDAKKIVGQKTLSKIKEHLLTYGSIDTFTCKSKFNVKSLHNFIWYLRKEGLKIKTDKVGLHNGVGQKFEVTNYRLISEK